MLQQVKQQKILNKFFHIDGIDSFITNFFDVCFYLF